MYRSSFEIIENILHEVKQKKSKTGIRQGANMSHSRLENYLDFLLRLKLVNLVEFDGKNYYEPTKKGLNFLKSFRELDLLLTINNM